MAEMKSLTLNDKTYDGFVDPVARAMGMKNSASGESITVSDSNGTQLFGLNIYGKSTQDGTPTPDAPVDLVSVGGGGILVVNVCGKNLANYDAALGQISGTVIDGDGFIISTNNSTETKYLNLPIIAPYREITISIDIASETDVYVQKHREDYAVHRADSFTYTANAEGWLRVMWVVRPGETSKIRVMAVRGSSAMPYEPPKKQTLTINTPNGLPGIPVTSGGNYTDANGQQWICDEIDLARGVYVQRVSVKAFDGTEGWVYESNNKYFMLSHSALGSVTTGLPLSSHFYRGTTSDSGVFFFGSAGVAFYHTATSVSEWKAFLLKQIANGTPVKLLYALATPIETPLTENELAAYAALHTYKDHTTVANDAGTWMDLEYVMDTKKYIDSLVVSGGGSIIPATVE